MEAKLSGLSARFLKAIDIVNTTAAELSRDIKIISKAKITHIKSGRNKPSEDIINAFLEKYPQINRVWLLTGEGEMLLKEDSKKSKVEALKKIASNKKDDNGLKEITFYPIGTSAGYTNGGSNEFAETQIIRMPNNIDGSICIPVIGDSMFPTIRQGDLVIMKEVDKPRHDYVHVIYLKEEGNIPVLKRVHQEGKTITLISDNDFYKPYQISINDIHKMYIVTNKISGSMGKVKDYKAELEVANRRLDDANKRIDTMLKLMDKNR